MALTASFYNCSDAPNTFNKTITPATAAAVTISNYEPINDLSGHLIISSTRASFNYMLLNGKYYFLGPREYMTNGLLSIYCEEDVLQTCKAAIAALPVVVGRNQVWKATEMYDPQLRTLQRSAAYVKKIGSFAYNTSEKILVTVG